MKSIDIDAIDGLAGRRLNTGDSFNFRCHQALSCFNKCCRNLNLFLYPYDVIRLKTRLGIRSGDFIDQHTDVVLREGNYFPDVLLKMSDSSEQTCPYLTDAGCSVYPDRPDACRTFPVEQGLIVKNGEKPEPVFFFKPPDFCEGQNEDTPMTIETWARDQDAETYNAMTVLWSEIKAMFMNNPWGNEGPSGNRAKMAFMALYNVDSFREFIFGSTFLKRYKVKPEVQQRIKRNDTEMMKFGFAFVKVAFFGKVSSLLKLR